MARQIKANPRVSNILEPSAPEVSPVLTAPDITSLTYTPLATNIKYVEREISAKVSADYDKAETFKYDAIDVAHYLKADTPAVIADAITSHVRDSSDIKAQGAYRRQRIGGKEKAAMTTEEAREYMLNTFSVLPSGRVRTPKADKIAAEAAKMSADDKRKLLEELQRQLAQA